jgi:hypothetical protein
MRSFLCFLGVASLVVVLAGCAAQNAPPPNMEKVSGKVTLDGTPMKEGEARFNVPGFPPKILSIKDGAFAGDAFIGKNRVEIVLEKDGPPVTDMKMVAKINMVAPKDLSAEVTKGGSNSFNFEVKSRENP